jgi:haloalkane dehalogenase
MGLVVTNSWMWSFAEDRQMRRRAALVNGGVGRFLYRHLNISLRVLMPKAYGDRTKLTPELYERYRSRFRDADSRERVLWPLAKSLLDSEPYFDGLWARRERLARVPVGLVWGLADPAFPPSMLARWREALPHAQAYELPGVGHWPHEENPDAVIRAITEVTTSPATSVAVERPAGVAGASEPW